MKKLFAFFGKKESAEAAVKNRKLRLENLERREMLSVTTYSSGTVYPEFNNIAAAYPELELDANVRVVEISGKDLYASRLQDEFSGLNKPCLFVLRTDSESPAVVQLDYAMNISPYKDFYVVAWGDSQNNPGVVFDAQRMGRVWYLNAEQKFQCANLTFANGAGYIDGAGLYIANNPGDYLFVDCNFINNENYGNNRGGAVCYLGNYDEAGSIVFDDCSFIGNRSERSSVFDNDDGRGTVHNTNPRTEFNRCTILNNESSNSTVVSYCDLVMNDCLIADNTTFSREYRCAFDLHPCSVSTFTNCTVANNTAGDYGMFYVNCGKADFDNCIVVNNTPKEIKTEKKAAANARNTLSDFTAWTSSSDCIEYTNSTPLFVDADAQDYRLVKDSPCVDAGDNSYVVGNTDLAGKTRIANGVVDMGAYEYQAETPTFDGFRAIVTSEEDGPVDHSDDFDAEGNAVNITLREALDYVGLAFDASSYHGDYQNAIDYFVADAAAGPGVYDENSRVYLSGTYDTVYFREDVETIELYDQLVITQDCTVDGKILGTDKGVTLNCEKRTRAFFVEETPNGVTIKNLNVINGAGVSGVNAGEDDPYEEYVGYGGAIYNNASLTIESVSFDSCVSDYGGAIYNNKNRLTSVSVSFDSCVSDYGGAVYNKDWLELESVSFDSCVSDYGGAVCNDASCSGKNVVFDSNSAKLGGGVYNRAAAWLYLENSEFCQCEAYSDSNGKYGSGGAIYNSTSSASPGLALIFDVKFEENNAMKYGGAVANYGSWSCSRSNFIRNTASYGGALMNAGWAFPEDNSYAYNIGANDSITTERGMTFSANGGYGGAVYTANNKTLEKAAFIGFGGSELFESNAAVCAGGAIDVVSGGIGFTIQQDKTLEFNQNYAGSIGGAIVLGGSDVQFVFDADPADVFVFSDNQSAYAPTIAAAVPTEDAKRVAEGFGFDYANLSPGLFDTFTRYATDVPNGALSYEYLTSLIGGVQSETLVVSYGANSVSIGKSQAVTFEQLGLPALGSVKICFAEPDASMPYELIINRSNDAQAAIRRVDLIGSDAAAFSFTSYAKCLESWSIRWGDDTQATEDEGLGSTAVFSHMYAEPGEYKIAVTVDFADDSRETYSFLFNNAEGRKDWTIDVDDSLLDDALLDLDFIDELFE